jgi:hypothetical protein
MRKVRGKLCRTAKGRFARCRTGAAGRSAHKRRAKGKSSCKFGVSKTTGRCLKRPRGC